MDQLRINYKKYFGDLISGIALLIFSLFILSLTFEMPMTESYAGVENAWYVSPALFPLIIAFSLLILSLMLIVNSHFNLIKTSGYSKIRIKINLIKNLKENINFYSICLLLLEYIVFLVPHIDFVLSSILFLLVTISLFYVYQESNRLRIFKIIFWSIVIVQLVLFLLIEVIPELYLDYIVVVIIAIFISLFMYLGCDKVKFKKTLIIAFLLPLLISTCFKYMLLVPLPKEGLIVLQVLDPIYYSISGSSGGAKLDDISLLKIEEFNDAF